MAISKGGAVEFEAVALLPFGAACAARTMSRRALVDANAKYEELQEYYSSFLATRARVLVWRGIVNEVASAVFLAVTVAMIWPLLLLPVRWLFLAGACVEVAHSLDVTCYACRRSRHLGVAVRRLLEDDLPRWRVMRFLTGACALIGVIFSLALFVSE